MFTLTLLLYCYKLGDNETMENIYTLADSYMYSPGPELPKHDHAIVNDTTYNDIANCTSTVLRSTDNPMYASIDQLNIVPKSNVTTSSTEELPIDSVPISPNVLDSTTVPTSPNVLDCTTVPTSPNVLDCTTGDIYSAIVRENGEKVTIHVQGPLVVTEEDT